jgi:hypothetical protein
MRIDCRNRTKKCDDISPYRYFVPPCEGRLRDGDELILYLKRMLHNLHSSSFLELLTDPEVR